MQTAVEEKVEEEVKVEPPVIMPEASGEVSDSGDQFWPIISPRDRLDDGYLRWTAVMTHFSFFPTEGNLNCSNHISPTLPVDVDI
jgi:hypothetical protein